MSDLNILINKMVNDIYKAGVKHGIQIKEVEKNQIEELNMLKEAHKNEIEEFAGTNAKEPKCA